MQAETEYLLGYLRPSTTPTCCNKTTEIVSRL